MTARLRSHAVARRRRPLDQEQLDHLTPEEKALLASNLLDADEVAAEIGLANGAAVRTYQYRHDDFPAPMKPPVPIRGKEQTWWAPDIRAWRAAHPPRPSRDVDEAPS